MSSDSFASHYTLRVVRSRWGPMLGVLMTMLGTTACDGPTEPPPGSLTFEVDFAATGEEWGRTFVNYLPGMEESIRFETGVDTVPDVPGAPVGLRLASSNRSDNLFMYAYRKVAGFEPHAEYRLSGSVSIASRMQAACAGAGGGPGTSVYLKLGALPVEPKGVEGPLGNIVADFDLGSPRGSSGENALSLDDIAVPGGGCGDDAPFDTKRADSALETIRVRSNDAGEVWVFIGTDSGFEGRTIVYLLEASLRFVPAQ